MKIYKICSLNEEDEDYVEPIAIKFSEDNNIIEDNNWANLKLENGLDGNLAGCEGWNKGNSPETRSKISKSRIGYVQAKDILTGNIITVLRDKFESDENLVGIRKGETLSEEHKKKISPLGRKHSKETKQKIGKKHKNKIVSESTREKLKNRCFTDEHRKNISIAAKHRKKGICIHCNKEMDILNLNKYHNDNCQLSIS